MHEFFNPKSVVVIGVSPRPENLGRNIVDNLDRFGFKGPIYQVSAQKDEYKGRPIYQDVRDLPETPDLAVVLTPAATLPAIFRACGEKGVRRLVVETAGFSELAEDRRDLEAELKSLSATYGIRFVGPNCLGLMNVPAGICLPFTPFIQVPPAGGLSIVSQSGGIGSTYMESCAQAGLGIAKFASVGNKLDFIESDFLAYMLKDRETRVILLYLESIVDGRRLYDLIRQGAKPVVVHKSNIAAVSNEAARSHTAALANDDRVVEEALRQAGAIRAHTIGECLEILKGLSLPRPRGKRLAVITRSGGHAVVAADAAYRQGMELVKFPASYLDKIRKSVRAAVIKMGNPLDLGDVFDFDAHLEAVAGALALNEVDCLALVEGYRGSEIEAGRDFMRRLGDLVRPYNKPLALSMAVQGEEAQKASELSGLPLFNSVEDAIMAFSRAAAGPRPAAEAVRDSDLDIRRCQEIAAGARPDGTLELPEALQLIAAAGVAVAPFAEAAGPEEAVSAGGRLGYPVVLKAVGISHKTEAGGVVLNISSPEQLKKEAVSLQGRLKAGRLVVMQQVAGHTEVILGGKRDAAFGPLLLFGLGGIFAEVLQDTSLCLAPLNEAQAGAMLDELRGAVLLTGFRGRPPADRAALVKAMVRVAALLEALPQIEELDINPLMAGPEGAVAVDARVVVKAA